MPLFELKFTVLTPKVYQNLSLSRLKVLTLSKVKQKIHLGHHEFFTLKLEYKM